MEEQKQNGDVRRKLPVYLPKEETKETSKSNSQSTMRDYFEYSKKMSEVQQEDNLQNLVKHQNIKTLNKFSIRQDNGRQLHFYQPQREAEGWVRRTERFAESQRTKRREETINNKRQLTVKSFELNICLQNVRGLNSKLKQDELLREIEGKRPDFIGLVETRLQRIIGLNSKNIAQTQLARNGGVLVLNNGVFRMQTIKTLRQYITWTILNVGGFPLHIFTVYIPPYWNEEVKETQNRLIYMIKSLKQKCNKQRIIVMGDFNFHLRELSKRLNKEGLKESIPQGVETHIRGNQLDQIFSNVETSSWETSQLRLTDHKLLQVKLKLKFQENDLKLSDRENNLRIADIRKQCWKSFIEEGRELTLKELDQPIQKCFEEKLEKHFKGKNWYQQPPQWAIKDKTNSIQNSFQDTKLQWKEAIRDLEQCLDRNDLKGFFYQVKRLTKSQKQSQPIRGITINEERVEMGESSKRHILEYYNLLFKDSRNGISQLGQKADIKMTNEQEQERFCNEHDVEKSIKECNFNKAIGPDGFDGKILLKSEKILQTVCKKIAEWLNTATIPQYIKEGRLILLSKSQGDLYPEVPNTRPIVINSHLSKIVEKVIINKIQENKSELLKTGNYQNGFKENKSTHINLMRLLEHVKTSRRKSNKREAYLLVDLQKAYDSVWKDKMIEILRRRAVNESDAMSVKLIEALYQNNKIQFEGDEIQTQQGVAQGSRLSPMLFNIYLQDALYSQQELMSLIKQGKLIAFADDILININDPEQFKRVLECFRGLEISHNLKLNRKKTVFLSDAKKFEKIIQIEGICKVQEAKYLGMNICLNTQQLLKNTWNEIKQKTEFYQKLTKSSNPTVGDTIMVAQIRSLLIYKYTPLVAAQYVKISEIEKMELQLKRIAFKTSRDIPNKILRNVTQLKDTNTNEIILELVQKNMKKIKADLSEFAKIKKAPEIIKEKGEVMKGRKKLFLTKNVMDTMMAISQGRTIAAYGMCHYCNVHKVLVENNHLRSCNLINVAGDPTRFSKQIRENRIIDMQSSTQIEIITNMVWLDNRIRQLEAHEYYQPIKKQFRVMYVKKKEVEFDENKMK